MNQRPKGDWKTVPGCQGVWASTEGAIWQEPVPGIRVRRPGLRHQSRSSAGYLRACVIRTAGSRIVAVGLGVHVLVALAFHGPRPTPNHVPDHIDNNPGNNRATNLEWVTASENKRRAWSFRNAKECTT
jgi:hypothetical protein